MKFVLLISLLALIACDNYAVLVAGSNTWDNYRHQSDVFHAYQILLGRGMNPDNIIVFAYGDIADNPQNPFPGQVVNWPNGWDVYGGVHINYWGDDVTPENFIACLTGDAGSVSLVDDRSDGKVLASTSNDHVFIYFTDHGSTDLIAFPNSYLYSDELNAALQTMYDKQMYKELVFYLEACESGSMFDGHLPDNIKIYATTAANPYESSWAEYCGSDAVCNGTNLETCLGDEYSVRWMEDVDAHVGDDLKSYTMQAQYEYLVQAVTGSNVQQYGDVSIAQESLYYYLSDQTGKLLKTITQIVNLIFPPVETRNLEERTTKKIDNWEYRLENMRLRAERHNDYESEKRYYEEVAEEGRTFLLFKLFDKKLGLTERRPEDKLDFDCYRAVVRSYADKCGLFIDRDFKYMKHIANFCTKGISPKEADLAFSKICQ